MLRNFSQDCLLISECMHTCVCMSSPIHAHTDTYTHMHVHTYTQARVHAHLSIHRCACTHAHTCTYTGFHLLVCLNSVHPPLHTYTHTHTCTHKGFNLLVWINSKKRNYLLISSSLPAALYKLAFKEALSLTLPCTSDLKHIRYSAEWLLAQQKSAPLPLKV